jgi:mono/diheme cytochrome c family protein
VRRFSALSLVLLAGIALLAAGCSTSKPGGSVTTATPTRVVGKIPGPGAAAVVEAVYAHGDPGPGKVVFTGTGGCAACHTLADAGAMGTVGPNLDEAKPDLALAVQRVTKGKGGMPPFKGTLTDHQIADVVAYVVKATS